jgi:dipeptidyl aminopeptidase/acylaminoacyl peptidase
MLPLLLALSSAAATNASADAVVYRDRVIDVRTYVEGFPYKSFFFEPDRGRAYFIRKGDSERLFEADLSADDPIDFTKARKVSDVDFSKRSFWGVAVSPATGAVYVRSDEDNTEIFNIYERNDDGTLRKLTNEGYIYDWALSPDGARIAYTARSGPQEFTPGSVGIVDLRTRAVRTIYKDSKERRMTWGTISWKPDQSAVVLPVVCNEDRTYKDLLLVPTDGGDSRSLLDCTTKHSVYPAWEWLDDSSLVYTDNQSGNLVAHHLTLDPRRRTPLTDPAWNLVSAQLVGGASPRLVALERRPISGVLHVIDPKSGQRLSSREIPAALTLHRGSRAVAFLSLSAASIPFEVHSLRVEGDELKLRKIVEYDEPLKRQVVHCDERKISFKTFDGFAAPGEEGTLHAFLYVPRKPAAGADARLLVESFYGGVNDYYAKIHMFCQAGFHVLSPAPRGSWEWGRPFHDKMQGDLGGGEILDVVEAAKAVSRELKIPPEHVGAFGGSHGGYATLRALTLPDEVNGHRPGFHFGFGVSDFGIANLVRYVQATNIPGWITEMTAEDPVTHPEKWLSRSPETRACSAHGPLFLAHGANDKRVGVEESRAMHEALKKCGRTKDVYLELPGQGHGFKGTAVLTDYYRALFGFLSNIR